MNRRQQVEAIVRLEGVAAAAAARAATLRAELEADAKAELAEQGAAPTWRIPGVGTVLLSVSKEAPVITDETALTAWVAERHPSEVETIEQIRPAFRAALLRLSQCDGDKVAHPATGEPIPGMTVRPGGVPRSLSFRLDNAVKQAAAADADVMLESLALLASETPGHLAPSEVQP